MGQDANTNRQSYLSNNSQWKQMIENQQHPFYRINPFCQKTFYNELTNEYVEEYFVKFASEKEYKNYIGQIQSRKESGVWNERKKKNYHQSVILNSPYIYPVREFINTTNENLCSVSFQGLVYMEKVELRLKEINDIPFTDQLYLLKSTLEGFKILYEKAGYFDICEEMIFITRKGQVRVWLNPNLSKTSPFFIHRTPLYTHSQQFHGSQSEMIAKLIIIIQQNSEQSKSKTIRFSQYLINKGIFDRLSFYRALEELQFYCLENRFFVDDHMRSVYDLHHDDQEVQEDRSIIFTEQKDKSIKEGQDIIFKQNHHHRKYSSDQFKVNKSLQRSHASGKSKKSLKYSRFAKKIQKKANLETLEKDELILNDNHLSQDKYHTTIFQSDNPICLKFNQSSNGNTSNFQRLKDEFTFKEDNQIIPYNSTHKRNNKFTSQSINQSLIDSIKKSEPVVKINYCNTKHQYNDSFETTNVPLSTINKINSQSTFSFKEGEMFESKTKETINKLNYYTPDQSFALDDEIAEDLKNILGFCISLQ